MRGRNPQADQFQTGTLTMRIVDQNGDFNPQNPASPYYTLLTPMRKVQSRLRMGQLPTLSFQALLQPTQPLRLKMLMMLCAQLLQLWMLLGLLKMHRLAP